jgi:hypothetical protein
MFNGHYFEISTTVHSSNWDSATSGFHYATPLVWLQEWHPLMFKGLKLQEEWLWPLGIQYSAHGMAHAQV